MLSVFHKLETTKKIKKLQGALPLLGTKEVSTHVHVHIHVYKMTFQKYGFLIGPVITASFNTQEGQQEIQTGTELDTMRSHSIQAQVYVIYCHAVLTI